MKFLEKVLAQSQRVVATFTNPMGTTTFQEVMNRILRYLFWLGIIFYFIAILLGSYHLMTSGGNPRKIELAKKIFIYSTIGFLIVISPGLIIRVFIEFLR